MFLVKYHNSKLEKLMITVFPNYIWNVEFRMDFMMSFKRTLSRQLLGWVGLSYLMHFQNSNLYLHTMEDTSTEAKRFRIHCRTSFKRFFGRPTSIIQ